MIGDQLGMAVPESWEGRWFSCSGIIKAAHYLFKAGKSKGAPYGNAFTWLESLHSRLAGSAQRVRSFTAPSLAGRPYRACHLAAG